MQTGSHTLQSETTAEALLELLAARGIDYFLAAGTGWGKSRKAAAAFAPQGWAAKAQDVPLCELGPSPAYHRVCEAAGGYGERVENPDDLPAALARAARVVRTEGRQALVNVKASRD
jgi:hypothetical protein